MNSSIGMNGYTKAYAREVRTPAILVLFARFVLWLTKDETIRNIKCGSALGCAVTVAVIAGAIGMGAVPFVLGIVAAFAFGGLGLLLTFDLN